GRRDGRLFVEHALPGHGGDDLTAVEAAVFDEDFAGVHPAYHHARDVDAWHVAFEAFGIRLRLPGDRIETNSLPLEKLEVGMIAGHGEYLHGWERLLVRIGLHPDFAGLDALHLGIEERRDFAGADAVLDVGLHPVFQALAHGRVAM